jgi:hypothetical protein
MTRSLVLTLTGSAQRLTTALGLRSETTLRVICLQPGAANAAPVYLGGSAVSASVYGVRLEAAESGVPPAPFLLGEFTDGTVHLEDWYVLGANTETLHVFLVDHF